MTQKERSKLKKKLDTIWSKKVKDIAGNICEKCHCVSKRLNSHHIISRRYVGVRYNLNNGICLCVGCHFMAHQNSIAFGKWILKKRGESWFDILDYKKNTVKVDLKMIEIELKNTTFPGHGNLTVQENRRL